MQRERVTMDGNEAAAHVAYHVNEVIAIYPITPSSPMGELADQWASEGRRNVWGAVPKVIEMQSEAGAAGAVHGSLQAGALTTTFTASQGLLLMIPNMYKIAGELTAMTMHVAARSLACQGLSIFGDHSDVMSARATGFAMLCAGSVQEVMDLALVSYAATLESRIPFLHFFDGFRTSHELMKIETIPADDITAFLDSRLVIAHRQRALSPDHPVIRGTAQNPDVYFQARESVNPFYRACPRIVQNAMDRFGEQFGRKYRLFDYVGAPDAERVIVLMGSGAEAAHETVESLLADGAKVGVVKVRLFRPFSGADLLEALPRSTRSIAVLDRTKEPGSLGEPLYLDVLGAIAEAQASDSPRFRAMPRIIGGRYGLSSKEFTPAMVRAIFNELDSPRPKNHFTISIHDDVSHTSLEFETGLPEPKDVVRAVFYGLGSDGTVGANKNSIKIIGGETELFGQGYFVYDSKKAGSMTVSHLRFGPRPIRSTYLIERGNFVACHQFSFLERVDVLELAEPEATFLLNCPYPPEEAWDHLPRTIQKKILDLGLKVFVIDGDKVAQEAGMGGRVNTIMQTCFFALAGVLPREEAIAAIKRSIQKTYGKRGEPVVRKNFAAVDSALAHLAPMPIPDAVTSRFDFIDPIPKDAPDFLRLVTREMIARRGDLLPVSRLPVDGTFPVGTTRYEKRNIAREIPVWDQDICIQCGKCVLVCPHAVIRAKVVEPGALADAPEGFLSAPARWKEFSDQRFTLQVAPEDCTGCTLCVEVCPVKNKSDVSQRAINMRPAAPLRDPGRAWWDFFTRLPNFERSQLDFGHVKDAQLLLPLFEFSGACAGCGETPYVKLMSQLFGDRAIIANATGCSSIYGGNLPTTPWTTNAEGRGPAWSNSLFEDNAEFGLGIRLAVDQQAETARALLQTLATDVGNQLTQAILNADQSTESGIAAQRERVRALKEKLRQVSNPRAHALVALADSLVRKSVWILGGDGWAYDIGFGGVDHVLASGQDVNLLVLDTEVYSNTGGQMSKSTPRAAVAKFASAGKQAPKKDLAMIAMTYGAAYIARVAMGANDSHTLKAFREAESFPGPSLILAYSHCIAHGFDLRRGMEQQKLAVETGYWPLFRFDPRRRLEGKNPLELDSRPPSKPLKSYIYNEARYAMLAHAQPERARELLAQAESDVRSRWEWYQHFARLSATPGGEGKP